MNADSDPVPAGAPAFADTNILVYAFAQGGSPRKTIAQELLNRLMEQDTLRVSTQVLQELFVTLTRKVARPCSGGEALQILEDLTAWPLTVVDYTAIRAAAGLAGQARISFWDALIVTTAVRSGAAVLYTDALDTEDLNHGQEILGIRVNNPFAA